ncbi:hypothetical protein FOMG_07396 [Fusarium oxysporum f. sp. melonis 26406]|uniref:CHAT domain-containing protein n=2 Tax=Fusarium oxysporum f. sp. melonis 26406 TaxID=1089452 RepID=X0B641_FUSOX|nr:hypothetical protein FOMG_07396 [Fusarium oxysporum f. sp. melonis 26406]EXK40611.1 hypothetical protein FOMG_07396 [Fusarium oxysporum f. sp. melonis 26406]
MDVPLEQMSEMSISPHYWGIHTSLYSSLPLEAVKQLERAIWLKMSGLANEARAIFDNELKSFAAVPVVAIEHADLELEAGKWGRAWRILNSKLLQLREAKEGLESPEHRLMLLTWAMLGTRHQGDVTSSAIEIERTQHWLAGVPVADYTDIQAGCIRRYVIASLFTRLYSRYNNPEAEHIPLHDRTDASGGKIPWGGLQLLRRSLTQRGMFNEANAVFRVEMNRTPPEDRGLVVNEFLEAIASIHPSRGRDYIEAAVCLQWATTHIQLQAPESAAEEFDKSAAVFQRFCDDFGIRNKEATPHMQAMAYERLSCIDDPIDKLERTEELAAHMEAVDGTKTGYCLAAAADLSRKYYEVTGMELFRTTYFDVQRRLDTYDQTVSEDICDLVHHHVDLNSVALAGLIDRDKALDWVDDFFKEYPHFDAPVVRALLLRSQASLLRSLRRQDEAGRVDEEAVRLETSSPSVGNWMHARQGYRAPTRRNTTSSVQPDPQHQVQDDDGEETFYWGWSDAIGDQAKMQEKSIQLVLKWLLEDITTGNSALEEFREMTEAALKAIVLPKAVDINELAEERYMCLCAWLGKPPVHQKNRRLFCLVMLRFGRQMHFSDLKLWDLRLSELQSLLELEESLPQIIRDKFPGSKGSWLGQMALTYMAPLDYSADFTSAESGERLSNAQAYNDRALDEYRRNKDLVRVALHQRSGAQICMFMIRRIRQLEQQAASSSNNRGGIVDNGSKKAEYDSAFLSVFAEAEVHDIRNRGISQAEEADEIFSLSELHASSSSGLEGITHRQSITASNANAFTILTAIELLLAAPGEPSDETITKVWQWVQKYKARSLARTIGVRISDPPELVSKIKACPDAARGYEEMRAMEQRIKEAQGMAKFNLRRQLDMYRRTMRETHDLMRQLLDLREAQPFDLSDVARIKAQSGTPIVLVDWFYLPPYFTGDTGRLLLLTVKERSKRHLNIKPTMDVLTTKVGDVIAWQKTYLTPEKFEDMPEENLNTKEARKAFDSMLGGLIAPLARRAKPGELIVLCPSSSLHRLPLHALAIKGYEALIHRNPVVYTHSQSLLRSCFAATDLARPLPARINARFISGIAESESVYHKAGRTSIQTLARRFRTDPMIDRTASKKLFLDAAGQSRLLHLHTHCGWESKDPLDHKVELPMSCAQPKGQRPVESVTAREFFDIQVSPGTHINMIACQGGVMDVQLGDEVMGLVPALMCSGASSTVSTLWRIQDTHGSRFAKVFFDSFLKQSASTDGNTSKAGGSLIVNLAKAMQLAADAMDEMKEAPLYEWAGYVLHGCWQFPLSEQDITSLQTGGM